MDEVRENFNQPTAANVRAETAFAEDVYANVALDAPTLTIRNVESHMQYAEDPRYHLTANKQPFRHDFHQSVWATAAAAPSITTSSSAATLNVRQAQQVPESIYRDAVDPTKNPKVKACTKMATMNPDEFAVLQESIMQFIDSVQERGSKKSADDRARVATHWYLMIQQFAPKIGPGGEWDDAIVAQYAPQFLPWLVGTTTLSALLTIDSFFPDFGHTWTQRP